MAAKHKSRLAKTFCRCIKHVRRTVKGVRGSSSLVKKEAAAIAICVKSVLGSRGKTLKRFKCGSKPQLSTQKPI